MAWKVEFDAAAEKDLDRLDKTVAKRLLSFLFDRLSSLSDPRTLGEALRGTRFTGLWKYRVGDYRIICKLEDERLVILVVGIGHRREVYR